MTTVSKPTVNVIKAPASQTISNAPQKVLIVGQQTGSTYTSGTLVQSIGNNNVEIANFGKGSMVSEMVKQFKSSNEVTRVDVIPLDDNGSGVASTGTVVFSGTSTEAGSLTIYVGSLSNHAYSLAIASGDTATVIGDSFVAALLADAFSLVTGINTAGSVALTAKNAGTVGDQIGLKTDGIVAGVGITLGAMSGGATDPVITSLFDVVGDERYQTVIYPSNLDITVLADTTTSTTSFLDPRWNQNNIIQDGVGVVSITDTLANLKVAANARNSQSLILHCNEVVSESGHIGGAIFELNDVIASEVGAKRALRLTQDANLSGVVLANNLDLFGGPNKASLPYSNTSLSLPLIEVGDGFNETEIGELRDAGGFVIGNNKTRTNSLLGEVATTYKTDAASNPDVTYKFLNRTDQHSAIAEFIFNNIKADFSQYRLTDGTVQAGYNIANKNTIESKYVEYAQILAGPDYLLIRGGRENIKKFKEGLTATLDLTSGKVTTIMDVLLVSQLRQFNITIKAVLN